MEASTPEQAVTPSTPATPEVAPLAEKPKDNPVMKFMHRMLSMLHSSTSLSQEDAVASMPLPGATPEQTAVAAAQLRNNEKPVEQVSASQTTTPQSGTN